MIQVLKAEDAVYGGYVISRAEGVVFIRGAIPGELVEVSVREKKRDYSVGSVTEIIEPSEHRVDPACRYFGECGGCQLQFVSYGQQVEMKNMVLVDCLRRIGEMDVEPLPPLAGQDFHYRLRGQFKVSKEGRIGFYREGTREVVDIEACPLMSDEINLALRNLRKIGPGGAREVHISHGDSVIALLRGIGFNGELAESMIGAGFSGVAFDDGGYRGGGYTSLDLDGLTYTISPWSFFQGNWSLNLQTVRLIQEWAEPLEGKRVLDMYAGAGNFSLPLADSASGVVAVEDNEYAIRDGERNVSLNKIKSYRYSRGSAESAKLKGDFDMLVLDPPRPGLSKTAIERVIQLSPLKIAYLSCNPATLSRDLKRLGEIYNVESVRMIDMFPNTYHIEALALLIRK